MVKESGDLHQDPRRAGWAAGGPGRCKAASETHKITSCSSISWAPSCTLSLCGTVVGCLTPVRCQDWSAVIEQGRGHCAVARCQEDLYWSPALRGILLYSWRSVFRLSCCLNNLAPSLFYSAVLWSIGYCKIQCLRGFVISSFSFDVMHCS